MSIRHLLSLLGNYHPDMERGVKADDVPHDRSSVLQGGSERHRPTAYSDFNLVELKTSKSDESGDLSLQIDDLVCPITDEINEGVKILCVRNSNKQLSVFAK